MRIGRFITMLYAFVLSLSCVTMNATNPKIPDFAYPKTVSQQSEKNLAAALRASDSPAVVRALIDYYLAQVSIDADKASEALRKIESVNSNSKDPALSSMLYLLRADIYFNIYNANRWKYDQRSVPLLPLPENYSLWSGEQFRNKILALTDSALSYADAIKNVPLNKYAADITTSAQTYIYYPTLYDFVANRSIVMLQSLSTVRRVFSWGLLVPHDVYLTSPYPKSDPMVARILNIYAALLKVNEGRKASEINTDLHRIAFIYNRVYNRGASDDSESRLFALLCPLYEQNKSSEYSGDILNYIGTNCADVDKKWLYAVIGENLASFPNYWGNNCLRNIRNNISQKSIMLNSPMVVPPGEQVKIGVRMENINSATINIYDVSSFPLYYDDVTLKDFPSRRLVAKLDVSVDGMVPFSNETTVEYTFPTPGNYIIVPVVDGKEQTDRSYSKIHVTHFALGASVFDDCRLWVVDAKSGAPVPDASLTVYEYTSGYRRQPRAVAIGKTASDGSKIFNVSGQAVVEKDSDKYASPLYVSNNTYKPQSKWQSSAVGFPALPLYHPGDTVNWTAVCYEFKDDEQRPRRDVEVVAVMRGASYEPIDTIKLVTDAYGRVDGSFLIPKDCLTGNFSVGIDNHSSVLHFEVSDYKLPSFRVVMSPVEKDVPSKGDVTIRGKVMTYSGFPLADTKITTDLSVAERMRWWWNRSAGISFYSSETGTNADGTFEIVVGASTLATAPIPEGVFTANVSALSSSGETQTADVTFVTGTKYDIRASLPSALEVSKDITPIDVKVVNYQDSIVHIPVKYVVKRDSTELLSGILSGRNCGIDFSSLPSGEYILEFTLENQELADKCKANTVIYRRSDKVTPVPGTLMWYPSVKVSVKSGKKGAWLYAVDCDTHLLVTLWNKDEIISRKWIKVPAGMHELEVELPDGVDEATMRVAVTGNYRSANPVVNVKRVGPGKGIEFVTESFRDRLVPGSKETWTFKVVDKSGKGRQAAVIMDMYNTALDALAKTDWKLGFYDGGSRYYRWNSSAIGQEFSSYFNFDNYKYKSCQALSIPDFNTYGIGFANGIYLNNVRMHSARLMARGGSASYKMAATSDFAADKLEEAVVEEEAYDMDNGASINLSPSESAVVTGSVKDEEGVDRSESKFSYRDSETPLAFFAPQLVTDIDGNLSFTFSVPNANTTWGFRAVAFTDSLLSTNFSADVVANKPVMVQPNLPRFVRSGDKVVISALVMNGSDEEQIVETKVELFNPTDGSIIKTVVMADTLAPSATATVDCPLTAPSDAPFIGYRVKSSTSRFADGEQSLLPVLPAITPVIDTYPFYIAPDSANFTMSIPEAPAGARVTLQFCENPVWYVVTALPGLLELEPSTANEAAASIFSAAIASGLLKDNPEIADALRSWENSDKSGDMLTSMLEKNEDLKIVLLSATPWMLDAKSDTERMTRLSLLFNEKTISQTYSTAISLLKRLERDGGGWAWYANSDDASLWATENVLLMMGRLRSLGFLPKNETLNKMILGAIGYMDKYVASQHRRHPSAADYVDYIYMRDYFKGYTATGGASQAISATVQNILKKWKRASVFDKAVYARILFNHGYPKVAKTIISSLREYAESSPEKGMWWASLDNMTLWSMGKVGTTALVLDAFATVEPGCEDIAKIRQWLILQKESMNWGTSVTASSVIASILSTSDGWLVPAEASKVYVGGSEIVPESVEAVTGYFRTPVPVESLASGELRVHKGGDTPSWGAVYYQYVDSMTDVKASACDAISIEKVIYSVVQTPDGPVTRQASDLKVGDKIKVQLTLKVDRDMDYVAVVDDRPACYEPVEQLSKPIVSEGIYFYRENRDSSTRFFITHLPKGTYLLTYDMWVNNAGSFTSGIATVQSQYAPQLSAHSAGGIVEVAK